jgi:chemotaxis receptor (MCP) glutamine deamidase CheD
MINLPEEQIFASETTQEAPASIVLNVQPGYQIENSQVEALFNLASRSVPNLSKDNIVIMDQNFEYFDTNSSGFYGNKNAYTLQQQVQREIERDIKLDVQRMLSMMIGQQKVVATVTADVDFTKENRVEELVEPVDPDVGVVVYDELKEIAGMAHIMLPDSPMARKVNLNRAKYADTAIDDLVEEIKKRGYLYRMKAKIAGGAQMFSFSSASDLMRIGPKNIEAVKRKLIEKNIPIESEDVGGKMEEQ